MKVAIQDVDRRRPVWEALSDLFLDTALTGPYYQYIARRIVESGYSPAEVDSILWDEVFPVIEWNLRHPCGVWDGFSGDWLQETILNPSERQAATEYPTTAWIIREAWREVLRYLPEEFRRDGTRS